MAAGDRETTLILKASDLSSQTIEKVLATAAKLLTFQETLNAKVASGTVRISEFNGSLNNILQVFTALAQMKLVFPETERLERTVAAQQARVEALKARAAEIQAIPEDERTRKQQSQLDRFTSTDQTPAGNPKGTIAVAEQRLDLTIARLQRNLDLERAMGVTEENRAALQAQINSGLERHTQELLRARNAQLEIIEANLRERDAQAELKRITEEIAAVNRRAVVDTKAQEAALRELTSEANAFDKAMRSAFEAAAKAADRTKGDRFKLDFGDAEFENKKRDEAARKAKADQEQAAAGSYRLMRAEADEENRIRNERAAEKKASDERAAADAYKLMREEADFENRTRDELAKKSKSTKQQAADDAYRLARDEAEFENKKRDEIAKKAKADQEQVAADAYRLMRARAEEENRIYDERIKERKDKADRVADNRFKIDYSDAAYEKAQREKLAADQIALAQQDAAHDEQQRRKREQQADALEASRRRAQLAQTQLPQVQEVVPAQQFDTLTRGLREIVSPADAARQTLNGLLLETVKLAEATRQSGQSVAQYRELLRGVDAAYRDIRGQAGLIDTYKQQTAAREVAGEAMHRERAALDELVAQYAGAKKADTELDRAIKSQEGTATRATNEFNRLGRAIGETQGQLRAAGIDFNDLAGSEKKLEAASGVLAVSLGTVKESILKTQQATASSGKDELTKYLDDARRKAADFRAGLPAIQPFGQALPGAGEFSKTTETVAAIDAIRDPVAAARQTFEGLRLEIGKTNAAFEASPKRIQDASKATGDLVAAFNDLRRQAGVFDLFRQAEAETVRTTQAMQEAVQKLNALERQQASATGVDENLTRAIKAQRAEVASSISAYNAANASFAKFKEGAHAAGLQTLDTNAQLKAFSETATIVSERLDALDKITGKSTKSQPVLFGLRGYELQNLGYQINDVVTGFASGQQALQILAQQGGQIFQIWERDIGTMLYNLRQMPLAIAGIAGGAALAVISVIALANSLDRVAEQRKIAGNLALDLDPGSNSAKALNEAAIAATHLGASYAEAAKGASELASRGFSDADVKRILIIAQQLSQARGKPFADSLKALQEVLHGSVDDVRKFSQEWVGLDTNGRKAIEGLIGAGKSPEARDLLMKMLGPAAEKAFKESLSSAANEMVRFREITESTGTAIGEFWDKWIWGKIIRGAVNTVAAIKAVADARDGLKNAPPFGTDELGRPVNPVTGPTTVPAGPQGPAGVKEGIPPEFGQARDAAADLVGVSREALKRLQDSEGQFKNGKWQDANVNGVPIPNGGIGAMQVVRSTFDEIKKEFPSLVKSDVHDLDSNLLAGALYFRKMLEMAGGDLEKAIRAYKEGPASLQRGFQSEHPGYAVSAQDAARGFTGPAVVGPIPKAGAATPTTTDRPNAQQLSTEEFQRKQAEQQFSETIQTGTLEQKNAALAARLDKIAYDVRKAATTEANKPGGVPVNEEAIKDAIKLQSGVALREYLRTLSEQDQEVLNFRRSIDQRELNADKTNLDNRLKQNQVEFDAQQRQANIFKNSNRFAQSGLKPEDVDAAIAKGRVDADNRTRAEVAAAIWEKFNSGQKAALDVYGNNIKHGLDVASNLEKARQEVASRAGAREEARQKAINTLQGVPDTAETRALRGRIESQAAIAARPPDLKQFTQEAAQQTAQPVEEQFKALEEMMKGLGLSVQRGARPFSEALQEATTKLQQRLPELTRATNEAVAGLQRLIDGGATPAQIEEYKLKQQELLTRLQNAPKDILLVINVGLEDSQKELESLVKRYKDLIAKAVQLQVRGLTGAAQEALNEAEKVRAQIGPARDKLVGNARQAAKTPGLPAGEVASLEERADKASKEGDPQQLRVQGILDQAKGAEEQIKQFQSSLREHAATEQQLLVKGLTTRTAYEAEMKRAYEETAAQAQPAIDRLLKLADAAEKAGASASKVAQLRDQAKLLAAELAYIPPLTQQIMTGFEQSFVSRGEQAFDAIAKAIGTAAVEGGKLKDVWRSIGNAFGNMAAGILQDVAKIIIKYELLKLVEDALGSPKGSLTGGGSGGGGSSTGGILQGILKVAGIAASAFAGGAGAVSDAGEFVGAGGGAATAADADALGAFGNDAAGAGMTSEEYAQSLVDNGASQSSVNAFSGHKFFHEGGIVGWPGGMSRPVDLSVFHEAQRMHSGGLVGLAHDEVPAILQKNEEVLSKSDPRNRLNAAPAPASGGGPTGIRNVLAVGDREIASAMNSSHGERVILNVLQRNAPTVKKYVG